jgi:hypothetical protein
MNTEKLGKITIYSILIWSPLVHHISSSHYSEHLHDRLVYSPDEAQASTPDPTMLLAGWEKQPMDVAPDAYDDSVDVLHVPDLMPPALLLLTVTVLCPRRDGTRRWCS